MSLFRGLQVMLLGGRGRGGACMKVIFIPLCPCDSKCHLMLTLLLHTHREASFISDAFSTLWGKNRFISLQNMERRWSLSHTHTRCVSMTAFRQRKAIFLRFPLSAVAICRSSHWMLWSTSAVILWTSVSMTLKRYTCVWTHVKKKNLVRATKPLVIFERFFRVELFPSPGFYCDI